MPQNIAGVSGSLEGGSYIAGDSDPAEFKYTNKLSATDLLSLFLRNPKIQKATVWFAGEMLRERWEFKTKQPISGMKHGITYQFKTFNEWLEWNGFMQEVLKAAMWSLLFGEAIIVFYDGTESSASVNYTGTNFKHLTATKSADGYSSCRAYYPEVKGNGYSIKDVDPLFGTPNTYKLHLHAQKASTSVTYYIDKSRVVRFPAPQKELKYSGTSTVSAIAHDCLVQEQIKRAVATQANNMQGGIVAVKAANETERDLINNQIGSTLTHLRRVYYKHADEYDKLVHLIIPDLKIDQLKGLNDILQTDIATGMDMSISVLEGSPQGAISSAGFDTMNTYAKVKQLQSHYTRALEECFFLFGKIDTTFDWNDPTPTAPETPSITPTNSSTMEQDNSKSNNIEEEEKENTTEDKENADD